VDQEDYFIDQLDTLGTGQPSSAEFH